LHGYLIINLSRPLISYLINHSLKLERYLKMPIDAKEKMEPYGRSPWYLHKIPSYAKASEGYPPSAKSAEAAILQLMNNSGTVYAFIHGQSPWSSA
jgi:hypothetical protein